MDLFRELRLLANGTPIKLRPLGSGALRIRPSSWIEASGEPAPTGRVFPGLREVRSTIAGRDRVTYAVGYLKHSHLRVRCYCDDTCAYKREPHSFKGSSHSSLHLVLSKPTRKRAPSDSVEQAFTRLVARLKPS